MVLALTSRNPIALEHGPDARCLNMTTSGTESYPLSTAAAGDQSTQTLVVEHTFPDRWRSVIRLRVHDKCWPRAVQWIQGGLGWCKSLIASGYGGAIDKITKVEA